MGTRASIGFRHKGQDWQMYHHNSGGPEWLGIAIMKFCRQYELGHMRSRVDQFIKVDEDTPLTAAKIEEVAPLIDMSPERKNQLLKNFKHDTDKPDWYDVLDVDGHSLGLFMDTLPYWPDYEGFMLNALSCEWGYIINLDTEKLEVYTGHYQAKGRVNPHYPKVKPAGRYADLVEDEDTKKLTRGVTLLDEIPLKDIQELPETALRSYADRLGRQY